MSERGSVRFGETQIEYQVIRSKRRRKTVAITIDRREGVIVSAPLRTPAGRIASIVRLRAGWIMRQRGVEPPQTCGRAFVSGETLQYLGRQMLLSVEEAAGGRANVRLEPSCILVAVSMALTSIERAATIEALLTRWYRGRAEQWVQERVRSWSKRAGVAPGAVLIRDQRRRWGSCSADGTLRFNWRIVMAEPALIDYVVVHELVHLRVNNHSAAYWAQVAKLMPDYKQRRARLKEVGPSLALRDGVR